MTLIGRSWPYLWTAASYFVVSALALGLTRFDGGVACLWVATALLAGRLLSVQRARRRGLLVACWLAGIAAAGLFGFGWHAAPFMSGSNILEAALGAALLRRARLANMPLQSLAWMAMFVVSLGVVSPGIGALAGATSAHLLVGASWETSATNWFAAHALGNLTFTPIAVMLFRGDVRRWAQAASNGQIVEAALLLVLVAATSVAVFAQDAQPLLFVPMLPIMLTTFRVGRFGAAASIVILALAGGALTVAGRGPIDLMHGSAREHLQFFQFYLAATVLTVLPVAADLARRQHLFRALADSEARYRVLADTSTDIILNLHADGRIRFVSPSIRQLGGYEPGDLMGANAITLVAPEHRDQVADAHRRTLLAGGEPVSTEYLGVTRSGETRWFENHARAIVNGEGEVDGIVSVVRDIAGRKALECKLAQEALTDPLTGLLNRRGFDGLLERQASAAEGGCVALFDVDHFKRINDRWGHAVGDQVLKCVGEAAKRTVRGGDNVARIGGEEFAVLLPGATVSQAELICERLRRAVATYGAHHDGQTIAITISGGVAALGESGEDALHRADVALYRAKTSGRDRLALAA